MESHPPKPVVALTVGITGHRPHRPPADKGPPSSEPSIDEASVRAAIETVLAALQEATAKVASRFESLFDRAPPLIAVVSSLAEGSDRLAAQAALAKNIPLDVVLPCPRVPYEASFADEASRREFATLLDAARAVLILPMPKTVVADGHPLDPAYEAGGLTLLAQSDILLAVWDGKPARGQGGTAEIVDEAARQGTPIIVISPSGGQPRLRWNGSEPIPVPVRHARDLRDIAVDSAAIEAVVLALIAPPTSDHEIEGMRLFLQSPVSTRVPIFGWKVLRFLVGLDRGKKHRVRPRQTLSQPAAGASPPSKSNLAGEARMDAVAGAAGKIADYFTNAFRSAFVVNFGVGAVAAIFVSLSIGSIALGRAGRWHVVFDICGMLCVMAVFVYVMGFATRLQWHRRWFEARELAERLRVARAFWRLGLWPHSLSASQPAWTGWYMRAILREQPVYSGDLGDNFPAAKATLWELIDGQIGYHEQAIVDMGHIERTLRKAGTRIVFVSVATPIVYYFGLLVFHWGPSTWFEALITALAIALPAAGTALYGIRLIGDFEDSVHRSKRTLKMLISLSQKFEDYSNDLGELRACARIAADAMLADIATWRVAVESRNLGV